MTGRTVVLVQARMGSSRLPGKSLRPLAGRPMIRHVLERAASARIGPTWLVTSVSVADDLLAEAAHEAGFEVFRGSEWDVVQRMSEAAMLAQADTVVRITGDCPLLAPDVTHAVWSVYAQHADAGDRYYVSNDTVTSGWPDGTDTEVFPAQALHDAARLADGVTDSATVPRRMDPSYRPGGQSLPRIADREHVTPWIRRRLNNVVVRCPHDWRGTKLSVDTAEDFERVQQVLARRRHSQALEWEATEEALRSLGFAPRVWKDG